MGHQTSAGETGSGFLVFWPLAGLCLALARRLRLHRYRTSTQLGRSERVVLLPSLPSDLLDWVVIGHHRLGFFSGVSLWAVLDTCALPKNRVRELRKKTPRCARTSSQRLATSMAQTSKALRHLEPVQSITLDGVNLGEMWRIRPLWFWLKAPPPGSIRLTHPRSARCLCFLGISSPKGSRIGT